MARPNRLATEISPYLLQHATNPVDWYPWGEEALGRARELERPIFLSIGYATCHWCHVMERESFEHEGIARLLNEHFVCIKVDREERPDLDELYLAATVALSGSGGWPMTVFLTPSGEPFFAGTYFPPEDRGGRLGLSTLLERVNELWGRERATLFEQARALTERVRQQSLLPAPVGVSWDSLRAAARRLALEFDPAFGGFGAAPKFPPPAALSLLLRHHRRTGDPSSLHMVVRTLEAMASGGIYDQLGGGFARYSVDAEWLVPHFERTLYDNAQLAEIYLEAFQVTGRPGLRRVAAETLDYLVREMQSPDGGFFSGSDADSEGEEGGYHLFSADELRAWLGEPAATHFAAYYGVTEEGQLAGKNVLTLRRSLEQVARELGVEPGLLADGITSSRELVTERRRGRTPPDVDDQLITSWNGLAIRALALGALVLRDERYLGAALRAARYLTERPLAELVRSSRGGQAGGPAHLEDYAALGDGLLSLYEAGGGDELLEHARELAELLLERFGEEGSAALEHAPPEHRSLVARPRSGRDGALPSPQALAARLLARLGAHGLGEHFRERAIGILRAYGAAIRREPRAHCSLLEVADFLLEPTWEIVLVGERDAPGWDELEQIVASRYLPNRVIARGDGQGGGRSPLSADKPLVAGVATAYSCRDRSCSAPATEPEHWRRTLDELETRARGRRHRELGRPPLPGRATPEGTLRFRARQADLPNEAFRLVGGLTLSRLVLGTHRMGLDLPEHGDALALALGCASNVVDTSPSFALGDSERSIGERLAAATESGQAMRDELVLISKIGVALAGDAEELEGRATSGEPPSFTVPLNRDQPLHAGAFSLDPSFLVAQLESSLERLGVEHLDVCLVQNPEHLTLAGRPANELEEALVATFGWLEREIEGGRLGAYGVLTHASHGVELLQPERLLELARRVGGDAHGLRWLALPLNAAEREPLEGSPSWLESARRNGLSVLATRPLSSLRGGALLRLVEPPFTTQGDAGKPGADAERLASAHYRLASLEAEFDTTLAPRLRLAGLVSEDAVLTLGTKLGPVLERTLTHEQLEHAERTLVGPRLRAVLGELERAHAGVESPWPAFRDRYLTAVQAYLTEVRALARSKSRARLDELSAQLAAHPTFGPRDADLLGRPWNERALGFLWRTPGVDFVAVGQRTPTQVTAARRALATTTGAGRSDPSV